MSTAPPRSKSTAGATGVQGAKDFEVQGAIEDVHVRVVAYPATSSAPTIVGDGSMQLNLTAGVDVRAFASSGLTFSEHGRMVRGTDSVLRFSPGNPTSSREDFLFQTYDGHDSVHLSARARSGYMPSWELGGEALAANPATSGWNNSALGVGTEVVFQGRLYRRVASNPATPGTNSDARTRAAAEMLSKVSRDLPLKHNRVFVYPGAGSWTLIGNCDAAEFYERATIAAHTGVVAITPRGVSFEHGRRDDLTHITSVRGGWSFEVALEAGYSLADVIVDGVPMGVAPNLTRVNVPAPSLRRPQYVEVRTSGASTPGFR